MRSIVTGDRVLFDPDDRVRYLDHGKLWSFVIEGEFWRITAEGVSASVARELGMAFVRAEAVNDDPVFLDMMADVVLLMIRRYASGRALTMASR